MIPPIWQTPAGTLGTIPEGRFYKLALRATSPSGDVKFRLIAGNLPAGIQVKINGTIEGVPEAVAITQGVPLNVDQNITSRFTVRAYLEDNGLTVVADRTFSLTVTGQDAPQFITPAGSLGSWLDSTPVTIPLEVSDDDDEDLTLRVSGGELPPGLRIDGYNITGVIQPAVDLSAQGVNSPTAEEITYLANLNPPITWVGQDLYDLNQFDAFNYDYSTRSISKNYQFTLEVSDGKEYDRRTFTIFVFSRNSISETPGVAVDPGDQAALDSVENPGAHQSVLPETRTRTRPPLILTTADLGSHRHDNFFAVRFQTIDFDGDATGLEFVYGTLPPLRLTQFDGNNTRFYDTIGSTVFETTFDTLSIGTIIGEDSAEIIAPVPAVARGRLIASRLAGWIPDIGVTEETYTFTLRPYKITNPLVVGDEYTFTIRFYGNIETEITWNVPDDLGVILTGHPSTAYISATSAAGYELEYSLVPGPGYSLPSGLALLPTGELAGRPSFNQFRLDGGLTTFDQELATRLKVAPTTFDRTFRFAVNVTSTNNIVSVTREFQVVVADSNNCPWERVYMRAMLPFSDRQRFETIMTDTEVFRPELIYRKDDVHFGVSSAVVYDHAYGVASSTIEQYAAAIEFAHYRKHLVIGELRTAQALDADGEVLYEVVYAQIVDDLVTADGISVSRRVRLPPLANPPRDANDNVLTGVYPNSLPNMRNEIYNEIGTVIPALPRWMTSKQVDGRVIGFVPAWVLAYTKPGKSTELLYRIQERYGNTLNELDFYADRYTIDKAITHFWDPLASPGYESVTAPPGAWLTGYEAFYGVGNAYDKYVMFPQQGLTK